MIYIYQQFFIRPFDYRTSICSLFPIYVSTSFLLGFEFNWIKIMAKDSDRERSDHRERDRGRDRVFYPSIIFILIIVCAG